MLDDKPTELRYKDILPLRWEPLDETPRDALRHNLNVGNEHLLNLLSTLEGGAGELSSEEELAESKPLLAIDLKLRILLEMVGELLARDHPLPDATEVDLGTETVLWLESRATPQEGREVLLELYFHPALPKPFRLLARITAVHGESDGHRVSARLSGLSDALVSGLEKLIFRHHRRQIAIRRQTHHDPF